MPPLNIPPNYSAKQSINPSTHQSILIKDPRTPNISQAPPLNNQSIDQSILYQRSKNTQYKRRSHPLNNQSIHHQRYVQEYRTTNIRQAPPQNVKLINQSNICQGGKDHFFYLCMVTWFNIKCNCLSV